MIMQTGALLFTIATIRRPGMYWNFGPNDKEDLFYYQLIPTAVMNATTAAVSAYLYPMPSTTQVQLKMQWGAPQKIVGTVCNANGKLLIKWTDAVGAGPYAKAIAVDKLAPGKYFVHIDGAHGDWNGSFLVIH
jgi:hypothetical protein